MYVIGDAPYGQDLHSILPRDTTQVRPEPFAQARNKDRLALFRREDTMMEGTGKRMHSFVRPDFALFLAEFPVLNRWAILKNCSFLAVTIPNS